MPRYRCLPDGPDAATRGCAADSLASVSLSASSVYFPGFSVRDPSVTRGLMQSHQPLLAWTSHMDALAPTAWASLAVDWVDVFVATPGGLFRQFPGGVGDLTHDASGRRTYNASSRSWYASTRKAVAQWEASLAASGGRRTRADRLVEPPTVILPPYMDAFERGALISIATVATSPNGRHLGVVGADLMLRDLDDVIGTLRSGQSGGARECPTPPILC